MMPTDAKERKDLPIFSGFLCYFPDAIIEVTKVSVSGNEQHNPGKSLRWDRSKSSDELDSLARHLLGAAYVDTPLDAQIDEAAARSWRSLADLQKLCEKRDENSDSKKIAPRTYPHIVTLADGETIRRNVDFGRSLNYGTSLTRGVAESHAKTVGLV